MQILLIFYYSPYVHYNFEISAYYINVSFEYYVFTNTEKTILIKINYKNVVNFMMTTNCIKYIFFFYFILI